MRVKKALYFALGFFKYFIINCTTFNKSVIEFKKKNSAHTVKLV